MVHVHCILDTLDYKHTLRICNTFCFPLQQCLLESTSMLRYIHTAILLIQRFFGGVVSNSEVICHLMGYFNSISGKCFGTTSATDCYC
jgi:hypothetical protein